MHNCGKFQHWNSQSTRVTLIHTKFLQRPTVNASKVHEPTSPAMDFLPNKTCLKQPNKKITQPSWERSHIPSQGDLELFGGNYLSYMIFPWRVNSTTLGFAGSGGKKTASALTPPNRPNTP